MATIHIKHEDHYLIVSVSGELTAQEMTEFVYDCFSGVSTKDIIWDLTDATAIMASHADMKRLALAVEDVLAKENQKSSKCAFVGDTATKLNFLRMYSILADLYITRRKHVVFDSFDDAREWISSGNGAIQAPCSSEHNTWWLSAKDMA